MSQLITGLSRVLWALESSKRSWHLLGCFAAMMVFVLFCGSLCRDLFPPPVGAESKTGRRPKAPELVQIKCIGVLGGQIARHAVASRLRGHSLLMLLTTRLSEWEPSLKLLLCSVSLQRFECAPSVLTLRHVAFSLADEEAGSQIP